MTTLRALLEGGADLDAPIMLLDPESNFAYELVIDATSTDGVLLADTTGACRELDFGD